MSVYQRNINVYIIIYEKNRLHIWLLYDSPTHAHSTTYIRVGTAAEFNMVGEWVRQID